MTCAHACTSGVSITVVLSFYQDIIWSYILMVVLAIECMCDYVNSRCLSCAGGRQGKLPVAAFEVYDFQTSRWRRLPDIPSKRVFALYAHSDSHIFSVGGLQQDAQPTFSDVTEVFDLDTGELCLSLVLVTPLIALFCCIMLIT